MSTYTFASNATMREIEPVFLAELMKDDPLKDFFPDEIADDDLLIWEQEDFITGLQQWRGLDGPPLVTKALGVNQFMAPPGYYGEFIPISETEITRRRRIGTFAEPIDLSDVQLRRQKQLWVRRRQLIRKILWDLCSLGLYQITDITGAVVKAAGMTVRSYIAPFSWSNFTQSGPLADFTAVRFFQRGVSADFGRAALACMNLTTFANFRQNLNPSDVYGRRTQGLGTFNSFDQLQGLLTGDDLPKILVYDEVYYDDAKVKHTLIPDNTVVVLAPRASRAPIGAYRFTRNASNIGAAPGAYSFTVDSRQFGRLPATIECHDGHNGGPVVYFPSSIGVMSV